MQRGFFDGLNWLFRAELFVQKQVYPGVNVNHSINILYNFFYY